MNADEFARLCRAEKDSLVATYFEPSSETAVGALIGDLALDDSQSSMLRAILDGALTDAFYTLLVALDGGASLGDVQQTYELRDESGSVISDCGDLEAAAFEHFQE